MKALGIGLQRAFNSTLFIGELEGFQPVQDCAVFAPGRARSAGNWFDTRDRLTLHCEIDFGVAVRGGWACMSEDVADDRQIDARFEKGHGCAVADAVRVQPFLS